MDTDFHYFGTATAAKSAGFKAEDAAVIANAAEFVDFFNSDYWSNWTIENKDKKQKQTLKYPMLSCQTIGAKLLVDYSADLWNAFHFPPGNLEHEEGSEATYFKNYKAFKERHIVRKTNLSPSEQPKLCRPYSPFALAMIDDTINTYKTLKDISNKKGQDFLNKYLDCNGKRIAPENFNRLALIFLGVRMHVLADTWAHQDFTGGASNDINGAGTLNYVYATQDNPDELAITNWTGSLWVLGKDTDCSVAPNLPGDKACRGHGQMGHFPDYSWLKFIYPAAWLPNNGYLLRNNPEQYIEAWRWLRQVMQECLGKTESSSSKNPLSSLQTTAAYEVPKAIYEVISKPIQLDNTALSAVEKSELRWKKLALCTDIIKEKRWNNEKGKFNNKMRTELGVVGDLPWTRHGTVKILQSSDLHLMEVASSMHYHWCTKWGKSNPNFEWKASPLR